MIKRTPDQDDFGGGVVPKSLHRRLHADRSGVIGLLAIILVLGLVLLAVVVYSGWLQEETPKYGLAGFHIAVPVQYYVQYTSKDMGGDEYDSHQEEMYISAYVDTSAISSNPVYYQDFAEVAAAWVGQRIPGLHNQDYMVDESVGVDGFQDPDPEEDYVQSSDVLGEDGYTVYTGGKWAFEFLTSDGSTVYTKTVRNAILLRIPTLESGVETYRPRTIIHVYIPKWRLPDEGQLSLNCKLNYELQGYDIKHDWDYGAVWDAFVGYSSDLVDAAIERGQDVKEGFWDGVGSFIIKAAVVGIAVLACVVFPVSAPAAIGLAILACGLAATLLIKDSSGQEQEVPALRQSGYDNPRFIYGSGYVEFTVILDPEAAQEGVATASKIEVPGGDQ